MSTKFFSQAKLALKQNFGSKFYKIFPGLKFYSPTSRRLRIVLGSKLYKPLQVWGFIRKQSLHKAFLLFREQRGFKGYFSFFVIKKRNAPLTPKRKNILKLMIKYSFFVNNKTKADFKVVTVLNNYL